MSEMWEKVSDWEDYSQFQGEDEDLLLYPDKDCIEDVKSKVKEALEFYAVHQNYTSVQFFIHLSMRNNVEKLLTYDYYCRSGVENGGDDTDIPILKEMSNVELL